MSCTCVCTSDFQDCSGNQWCTYISEQNLGHICQNILYNQIMLVLMWLLFLLILGSSGNLLLQWLSVSCKGTCRLTNLMHVPTSGSTLYLWPTLASYAPRAHSCRFRALSTTSGLFPALAGILRHILAHYHYLQVKGIMSSHWWEPVSDRPCACVCACGKQSGGLLKKKCSISTTRGQKLMNALDLWFCLPAASLPMWTPAGTHGKMQNVRRM